MKLKIFIVFLLFVLFIFSCENKKRIAGASGKVITKKLAKVRFEIAALSDSVNFAWDVMIADDDQMLNNAKRLLDEVSYMPKYNILLHDSLLKLQKKLILTRYDEVSMAISDKIDQYDLLSDSLTNTLIRLLNTTPNVASYPLCEELINEIRQAYNKAFLYRVRYDNWAEKYNEYIKKYKKQIEKLKTKGKKFEEKPLFQIQD